MSGSSPAERKALVNALPFKTVAQRIALIRAALAALPDGRGDYVHIGYLRPVDLLDAVLEQMEGPRTTRAQAIERLAKRSAGFGSKNAALGGVVLCERLRKKTVRWVPPSSPYAGRNPLSLGRLMEALATDPSGQARPAWLQSIQLVNLDEYRDAGAALKVLTTAW